MKWRVVVLRILGVVSLPVRGAWIEIVKRWITSAFCASLPVRGAWIEMIQSWIVSYHCASLPVRGAWIEISWRKADTLNLMGSLPVRGAWIEIPTRASPSLHTSSLPVRGAWIEMLHHAMYQRNSVCRSPCGERGLKLLTIGAMTVATDVAPRAGSVD